FSNHRPTPVLNTLSLHDAFRSHQGNTWLEGRRRGRRRTRRAPRASRAAWSRVRRSPPRSRRSGQVFCLSRGRLQGSPEVVLGLGDRKSTRLNSSHLGISYAVFC